MLRSIIKLIALFIPAIVCAEGLYVGGQAQRFVSAFSYNNTYNFISLAPVVNQTTSVFVHRRLPGYLAGIYAGYGKTFWRTYLGLEADADWGRSQANFQGLLFNNQPYNLQASIEHPLGLRALFGYYFTDSAKLYVALGFVRARLRVSSAMLQNQVPDFPYTNFSKWLWGGSATVGAETQLNEHWRLRLQYSYLSYHRFSQNTNNDMPAGFSGGKSVNYQLSSSQYAVGIAYDFGTLSQKVL